MLDQDWYVDRAEKCVELMAEAETKAEYNQYAKEYKACMIKVAGKDIFRKPKKFNNKPSKALIKTMKLCKVCQSHTFTWKRESGKVQFSCKCGYQTDFYDTNSEARNEWNKEKK